MRQRLFALLPLTIAGLALSACQFEAGLTASSESIAGAAADALEEEIGERPEIDCGDKDIIVDNGKEVDCILTDPATGTEYDTVVTLQTVGDDEGWSVQVEVADEPIGGSTAAAEDPTEAEESQNSQEPQDDPTGEAAVGEVEDAIADALEPELGARPTIDCGEANVMLYEGRTVYCEVTDEATGDVFDIKATFSGVTNGQWMFDIELA